MDVQHLPLEHPATYKRVRDLLVGALVPALTAVLEPTWATLPKAQKEDTADTQRRDAMTGLLLRHRENLQQAFFVHLQPIKPNGKNNVFERETRGRTQQRDATDTTWDMLLWLLDALLHKEFPDRKVTTMEYQGSLFRRDWGNKRQQDAQGGQLWISSSDVGMDECTEPPVGACTVPFFLDQLARKLAGMTEWDAASAARCVQNVFSDLSAEHTLVNMQWFYGQGGDFSVNRISQVLRPVDTHQNRALGLLAHPKDLETAVTLVLGTDYRNEEFRVRQVTQHRLPMPVPWLMNWTDHFKTIQDMVMKGLTKTHQNNPTKGKPYRPLKEGADGDGVYGLTPLSSNPDVYIHNKQGQFMLDSTVAKIDGALQQLFNLHQMGRADYSSVNQGELLDRLIDQGLAVDGQVGETPEAGGEPWAVSLGASHPLMAVFECLDDEPEPLVMVAVLMRLCSRSPDKGVRLELQGDLKLIWEEQRVFERLGLHSPRYDKLTDKRLALACGLPLKEFQQRVEAGLQRFDSTAALAGEAAEHAGGAFLKVPHPMLRVGVALRLLQRLPSPWEREQRARALWEAWSDTGRFDGGLFDFLGADVAPPKPPADPERPWAEKALTGKLTDDVLAFGMDTDEDSFRANVEQALAQFDMDHPTNPRSPSKAGSAKAGAKK